ncbi:hypothetical protein [Spiroplasma sp. BIUS-1]|uniref:hypothetical protein n=1 Tax=Spiroplasma sp. BIUS-1 TaxID=216964 RepID=UPI001396D86F|nr:hypothetical protein [Spiroplasma sp. BIUS-1]QHX36394.1 hypothetical protein SBIUS_v1c01410 [Spiroplasma sp. BIUS-1]
MKKIIFSLSTLIFTILPASQIISCQNKPEPDEDYFIPNLKEQPKSIEEIEILACEAYDKNRTYTEISTNKWDEYKNSIPNWNQLSQKERDKHNVSFNLNSMESQKQYIFYFWVNTYEYKIYQFNPEYDKTLTTPNGNKLNISAQNNHSYDRVLKLYLEDQFITKETKDHIQKIYNWGMQENPNTTSKKEK